MADHSSIKSQGRMRTMSSPKTVFPSSFRRNMDPASPARSNTSSAAVDYDDVFGGPPKFVTSMLAAQMGPSILPPSSRGVSRTPSFRSSAFPVYDLPVFGDESSRSGNINAFSGKTGTSNDDSQRFSEGVPPASIYGYGRSNISRSKPSSLSSSRGTSPLHAESSLSQDSAGNKDQLQPTQKNLAAFLKSRSAAGKLSGRNSPSYSFEDANQRPLEKILRKDAAPTSLPSSPPHPAPWDHMKKKITPKAGYSVVPPTNADLDDVFGGFPKRIYAQPPKMDTYKAFTPGSSAKPHMKMFSPNRSSAGSSESGATATSSRLNRTVSSLTYPYDDQELRDEFIEISMEKNAVSSSSDKLDGATRKPWITINDLGVGNQQSMKQQSTRPPVVPVSSQLKLKSWKDWTSDLSEENAGNEHRKDNMSTGDKESVATKRSVYDLSNKQHSNTFSGTLSAESYVSSKPLGKANAIDIDQTSEIEESELQALLRNAWKKNEEREKPKKVEQFVQVPEKETNINSKRQSKVSQPQINLQSNPQSNVQTNVHWKVLRKHLNKNSGFDKKNTSASYFSGSKEAEFDSKVVSKDEYDVSVLREDVVESDSKHSEGVKYSESSQRKSDSGAPQGNTAIAVESHESEKLDNATNHHTDHCNDENLSSPEEMEDLECFDIGSSSTGLQEVEAESFERRQTKIERHMRAKERVAKALEEMQQRDAKAQQEQEEKHQLAATTDSHIKRWAAGKEGNLRALLSNLQYVLWQDSGWKPIPLTSLIEGSDVKKAYRKATLFVHPDKLQQKGANLQQKYIAERVFDILQEAWKIFNMQELY